MKSLIQYIYESKSFICYIMIGLPGSGKSTWIKNNLPKNIEILSKDLIRQDLGIIKNQDVKAIGNQEQEKEVKNIYHNKLEELLEQGKDFVIDNTNIGSSLTHILNRINAHNKKSISKCKSIGVNIKTPLEVCKKRRDNCIPEKVYDQMLQNFKYLTNKDVDEIINVEYKENIEEALDDNLIWKIDKYFNKDEEERKYFYDLVDFCRDNRSFNKKDLEEYFKDHPFKNLKKFVDFIDDVIKSEDENRDYTYKLTVILKQLISNKREYSKYTNKKEET